MEILNRDLLYKNSSGYLMCSSYINQIGTLGLLKFVIIWTDIEIMIKRLTIIWWNTKK